MILETERLMLREMTQSDFDDLAEMLCDPEVMYAYERDFSEEDVGQWLDNQLSRYKKIRFRHVERDSQTKRKYDRSGGNYNAALQGRRAP